MINLLSELEQHLEAKPNQNPELLKLAAKEYLQSYLLSYLYNHRTYKQLNFYGGSCLRIIYGLNRLSQDLDFDNQNKVDTTQLKDDLNQLVIGKLQLSGSDVHHQGQSPIQRFTIRLPILYHLGLSPLSKEKLHLKIEISDHQQLSTTKKTPVSLHNQSFVALHHDLSTLMSGKIIACLERTYKKGKTKVHVKGRDYYDLIWLMQKNIKPNLEKLKTDSKDKHTLSTALQALTDKINQISARDLSLDLMPLFSNKDFINEWLQIYPQLFSRYQKQYTTS